MTPGLTRNSERLHYSFLFYLVNISDFIRLLAIQLLSACLYGCICFFITKSLFAAILHGRFCAILQATNTNKKRRDRLFLTGINSISLNIPQLTSNGVRGRNEIPVKTSIEVLK